MARKARHQTSSFVFTGNPIVLESEGYPTDPIKGERYTVNLGGEQIYEGRFYPPMEIDISEIADSASGFFREPSGASGMPCELIEMLGPDGARRKLSVRVEYNEWDAETFEMTAIPGGIPRQQLRTYVKGGRDAFDSRFCGPACNFFFTSRTAGWLIEIRETELYPLYFISTGQTYIFKSLDGKRITQDLERGIAALDLENLRRAFVREHGILPSVIDVEIEEGGSAAG